MTSVTFSVFNLRFVQGKSIYALLDAELCVDGVLLRISGIQARHVSGGGTPIHLPCYRDIDGAWRAAVDLPDEVRDALADTVLEFMVDAGVARLKSRIIGQAAAAAE